MCIGPVHLTRCADGGDGGDDNTDDEDAASALGHIGAVVLLLTATINAALLS